MTSTKRRGGVEGQTGRCPTCGQTLEPTTEGSLKSGQQGKPETP